VLALRGALVLGTARTKEKAAAACAMFPGKAIGYACELSVRIPVIVIAQSGMVII
jgi:hypothetical protein